MGRHIDRRKVILLSAASVIPVLTGHGAHSWVPRPLSFEQKAVLSSFATRVRRSMARENGVGIDLFEQNLRIRIDEARLFDQGTAIVHQAGIDLLTVLARDLILDGRVRAEIVGHHHFDGQGHRAFIISARRATAVKSVLASRHVPASRLLATGLGDRFPIASNDTEQGRSENRRMDIVILPAG